MIKTVVGEYHWPPLIIDDLFVDDNDHFGLVFWYEAVLELIEQVKGKPKKGGKDS